MITSLSKIFPYPESSSESPWQDKIRRANLNVVAEKTMKDLRVGMGQLYQFFERSGFKHQRSWGHAYKPFSIDLFGPITNPQDNTKYSIVCLYKEGGEDFLEEYIRQQPYYRKPTNLDAFFPKKNPALLKDIDIIDNTSVLCKVIKKTGSGNLETLAEFQYRKDKSGPKFSFFVKLPNGRIERLEIQREVISRIVTSFSDLDPSFYDGCIQASDRPLKLKERAITPKWGQNGHGHGSTYPTPRGQ